MHREPEGRPMESQPPRWGRGKCLLHGGQQRRNRNGESHGGPTQWATRLRRDDRPAPRLLSRAESQGRGAKASRLFFVLFFVVDGERGRGHGPRAGGGCRRPLPGGARCLVLLFFMFNDTSETITIKLVNGFNRPIVPFIIRHGIRVQTWIGSNTWHGDGEVAVTMTIPPGVDAGIASYDTEREFVPPGTRISSAKFEEVCRSCGITFVMDCD